MIDHTVPDELRRLATSNNEMKKKDAISKIIQLAESGNIEANYAIATWILNQTNGFSFDISEARRKLERSSSSFYGPALHDLAAIEFLSESRKRYRRAYGHILLGSLIGNEDCIDRLIDMTRQGIGCYKDEDLADRIDRLRSSGIYNNRGK